MKLKIKLFARNIVNPESITDFISSVSKNQSDKIKIWCNTILKNYLKNEYDNLKEVTKSKKTDPDWLQEAVKRKDAQKIIIDKDFERLLVEHIFHYFDTLQSSNIKHSFSEAKKQTKEWEDKENLFNVKLTKGVKGVLKCEGGYKWFEITDKETLFNEGEVIQNCLRKKQHGPKYWEKIRKKRIKIFTLRDSKGIGHVGVEYIIAKNEIKQMLGKQNDAPIEIYHPFCLALIKYLKCEANTNILKFLNIIIIDNQILDIFDLPDDLRINGSLNLQYTKITKLPDNLFVKKDLELTESLITELPNNLYVGGDTYLSNTSITKLPKDFNFNKSLDLYRTKIIELPDNLKVKGDLYLSETDIIRLPNNLKVKYDLDIRYTNIEILPKDLNVGNHIIISEDMKVICENKDMEKKIEISI